MRKDVPGSIVFADDGVLRGDDETDTTGYVETWGSLEDRGLGSIRGQRDDDQETQNPIRRLSIWKG